MPVIFHDTLPASCTVPSPLSGMIIERNCSLVERTPDLVLSSPDISSQVGINASLLNSSQMSGMLNSNSLNGNTIMESESKNYLAGNWTFTGNIRENIISAKADLDPNSFYTSQGILQVGDKNRHYHVNGTYKIAENRMLLYFVSHDGRQSVYLLENIKNDSFYAFNPNSLESYFFLRISSKLADAASTSGGSVQTPASETLSTPKPAEVAGGNETLSLEPDCDPSYSNHCLPLSTPNIDCNEISYRKFEVIPPDPHRFIDKDSNGCES
jgi:hypothetical protein